MNNLNADLFVVVAFSILPDNIIDIPKYGCVNIHPSLLPKYKGLNTYTKVLKNREKKTAQKNCSKTAPQISIY